MLGVDEGASAKDITKAYRKLARLYHPDANQDDPKAEDRFKEISAAYDVLGDEARRKEYDEVRRLGPVAGGFGPGGPGRPGAGGFSFDVGAEDVGDLLGTCSAARQLAVGRDRHRSPARRRPGGRADARLRGRRPWHDDHAPSHVRRALLDVLGLEAKPGTSPRPCRVCNGRGVVEDNQGLFSFSSPCTRAREGVVIDDPCPTCRGTGVERRPRRSRCACRPASTTVSASLSRAWRPWPQRRPPGDLYVTCHVVPHVLFGRDGDNLTVGSLTFAEAALGGRAGADARRWAGQAAHQAGPSPVRSTGSRVAALPPSVARVTSSSRPTWSCPPS